MSENDLISEQQETIVFSAEEIRALGALMEKEMTTPEYYPMTLNALKNACNQKSNRNPVVTYDDDRVINALDHLRRKRMVIIVSGAGSRVRKYEHKIREQFFLSKQEAAVLAVLMLRGPQTVGELRGRTERMVDFESLTAVEEVLTDLMDAGRKPMPLIMKLPRQPGRKEPRYSQLLGGQPDEEQLAAMAEQMAAPTASAMPGGATSKITELEEKVDRLQAELEALRKAFEQFKQQFE